MSSLVGRVSGEYVRLHDGDDELVHGQGVAGRVGRGDLVGLAGRGEGVVEERHERADRQPLLLREALGEPADVGEERSGARRGARVHRLGEDALDPGPDAAERLGRLVHPVPEVAGQTVSAVPQEDEHELVLGVEVSVEGLGREAGLVEDVAELRVHRALALDDAVGGLDDAIDVLGRGAAMGRDGPGDGAVDQGLVLAGAVQLIRSRPPVAAGSSLRLWARGHVRPSTSDLGGVDLVDQGLPVQVAA